MLLERLLPYISFAIALSGLIVRIAFPQDSRRQAILTVVIIVLVFMTGIGAYQVSKHDEIIKKVSKHIIVILGNDTKTFDEIFIELIPYRYANFYITNETLEYMADTNKVGHKILSVRDDLDRRFLVV